MSELVDRLLSEYLAASNERVRAWHTDAEYHARLTQRRKALEIADRAMADAGQPEDTRRQVVEILIASPPASGEALQRVEEGKQQAAEMARTPPTPFLLSERWTDRG